MGISVDGKAIALLLKEQLAQEIKRRDDVLSLVVFVLAKDLATEKFLALKKSFADDIGVKLSIIRLPENAETEALAQQIQNVAVSHDGIVVQFPLPAHIDSAAVANAIPVNRDVDLISDAAAYLFEAGISVIVPPVVGAVREILSRHNVTLFEKSVVVVGEGRLVGKPVAMWARQEGAKVRTVNENTKGIETITKYAEVLILGAGVPGLITPDMIASGAVLIDAGTSEAQGKLRGDMDPKCAEKASLYTPVPGGVGPITVVMIFKNLLTLSRLPKG